MSLVNVGGVGGNELASDNLQTELFCSSNENVLYFACNYGKQAVIEEWRGLARASMLPAELLWTESV